MSLNINDFKSQLVGGGARPNLFRVVLPFPAFAGIGGETSKLTFLCKAASLPASNIGTLTVPFRGREVKMAGDRTFEPWTCLLYTSPSPRDLSTSRMPSSA